MGPLGLVLGLTACGIYFAGKGIKDLPEKMEQERKIAAAKELAPIQLRDEIREDFIDDWNAGKRDAFPERYMEAFEDDDNLTLRYIELMTEQKLVAMGYDDYWRTFNANRFRLEYAEWERRHRRNR